MILYKYLHNMFLRMFLRKPMYFGFFFAIFWIYLVDKFIILIYYKHESEMGFSISD